jgi:hypothetical protein
LVGPGGIFAIETKCRTKRARRQGGPDAEVTYDGTVIRFPRFTHKNSPEQARRNANWLAEEMSMAVGDSVAVRGIVALPGWWVQDSGGGKDVMVLSGKMVPSWIEKEPSKLSDELVRRVAHQLDRRCRDVEF